MTDEPKSTFGAIRVTIPASENLDYYSKASGLPSSGLSSSPERRRPFTRNSDNSDAPLSPKWLTDATAIPINNSFKDGPELYDMTNKKKRTSINIIMACLCCCVPKGKITRIICGTVTALFFVLAIILGSLLFPRQVCLISLLLLFFLFLFTPTTYHFLYVLFFFFVNSLSLSLLMRFRLPDISIDSITLNDIVGAFQFSENPAYPGNLNKMTIQLNVKMNVSIYNPNRYNLQVAFIDMKAYLYVNTTTLEKENVNPVVLNLQKYVGPVVPPVAGSPEYVGNPEDYEPATMPQIGFSNYSSLLILPSRQNISIPMVFTIIYKPDPVVGLIKDPAFAEVLNVCGVLGRKRAMNIQYVTTSTMTGFLKGLGYQPKFSGNVGIICPVTVDQISAVQDAVQQGGVDSLSALKNVFSGGAK